MDAHFILLNNTFFLLTSPGNLLEGVGLRSLDTVNDPVSDFSIPVRTAADAFATSDTSFDTTLDVTQRPEPTLRLGCVRLRSPGGATDPLEGG